MTKKLAQNSHRLPKFAKPKNYHLRLEPNLEEFTYKGQVRITLHLSSLSKEITLHAVDLKIKSAKIFTKNQIQELAKLKFSQKYETVTLEFAQKVKGDVILDIDFEGIISDQLRGFYKSAYQDQNQQTKFLATTQFEATDARRAFPCFDEPELKATFDLEVIISRHLQVISNTQLKKTKLLNRFNKSLTFETTPPMSTYLLAFVIGELEYLKTKTKNGTVVRVHTTPGKRHLGKFGLQTAKRALEYLEEYFAIKFPLKELDLLAIPDFAAGAMENWGAITFRETVLLVDEEHTSFAYKQQVAEVIAHELVHQWFGNLVTMKWWTYLWLNESFASYMAYYVVDKLFPEWNFWTKFVRLEQSYALTADSLKATHPVEVSVQHSAQIDEVFDAISYNKGASVLRMLSFYLGEANFRNSIRLYLKKFAHKNTTTEDLWRVFEQVTKKPIKKMMHQWVKESGYPVVIVAVNKSNKIVLSQSKFLQSLPKKSKSKNISTWHIPVQAEINQSTNSDLIMLKASKQSLTNIKFDQCQYFQLNPGEYSFYITQYAEEFWPGLIQAIKLGLLSAADRLSLVRSQFLLTKAGLEPLQQYLDLVKSLAQTENSYVVWSEITDGLNQISLHLTQDSKLESRYQKFRLEIFSRLISKVGFKKSTNESHQKTLLRSLAYAQAGILGDTKVIKHAQGLFKKYCNDQTIDPDLKQEVLNVVAKHQDNVTTFKYFERLYMTKTLAQEKRQILNGLLQFRKANLQERLTGMILVQKIRSQDAPLLISSGLYHKHSRKVFMNLVRSNHVELAKRLGGGKLLGRLFEGPESWNTSKELSIFEQMSYPYKKLLTQTTNQTVENIKINIIWKARIQKALHKYLRNH
ncbi:MAG: M1 family metallopeptidase [Candidatus Doudnabacteria bacterium]